MADDFGQRIEGLHQSGDTIVSTDRHVAVFGKTTTNTYDYLSLNASGQLEVTGGTQYAVDDAAGATDIGTVSLVVRDDALTTLTPADGDYTTLRVDSTGALWVNISNASIAVTASDLDIRDLTHVSDSVKIGDGTDFLAINGDGSINVVTQGAGDSVYHHNSANLVKDTIATVVTRSPTVDEFYSGVMASGAGQCEWQLEFGTTGGEAVLLKWWTTPSHPTEYIDLPDYLTVSNGETIRVRGTNREKAASPSSDFTGYASLIRKA
jgi:hypothetical protein